MNLIQTKNPITAEQALAQLRAMATKGVPNCVNLDAIDRIMARVQPDTLTAPVAVSPSGLEQWHLDNLPEIRQTLKDCGLHGCVKTVDAISSRLSAATPVGGGMGGERPAPVGEDPRGKWAWQPYKPTRYELEAALKQALYNGCELYLPQWSSKEPHLFIHEVGEAGVSFHCAGWADKTPRHYNWNSFWTHLQYNGGIGAYQLPAAALTEKE